MTSYIATEFSTKFILYHDYNKHILYILRYGQLPHKTIIRNSSKVTSILLLSLQLFTGYLLVVFLWLSLLCSIWPEKTLSQLAKLNNYVPYIFFGVLAKWPLKRTATSTNKHLSLSLSFSVSVSLARRTVPCRTEDSIDFPWPLGTQTGQQGCARGRGHTGDY